jgi:hypothetical protein
MPRSEGARVVGRTAEEIDDALEFNLPFIREAEGEAWRQVHALLRLVGRLADEAGAPELLWRDAEATLQALHRALHAAVVRGRQRADDAPGPREPAD